MKFSSRPKIWELHQLWPTSRVSRQAYGKQGKVGRTMGSRSLSRFNIWIYVSRLTDQTRVHVNIFENTSSTFVLEVFALRICQDDAPIKCTPYACMFKCGCILKYFTFFPEKKMHDRKNCLQNCEIYLKQLISRCKMRVGG